MNEKKEKEYVCEHCLKQFPSHYAKAGHISTAHRHQKKKKANVHVDDVDDVDVSSRIVLEAVLPRLNVIEELVRSLNYAPNPEARPGGGEPVQRVGSGGTGDLPSFVAASPFGGILRQHAEDLKNRNGSVSAQSGEGA